MGLIGGLLTLPLAPVRGLSWVFSQVVDEAEAQLHDPRRIRAELADAEAALERGDIDDVGDPAIDDRGPEQAVAMRGGLDADVLFDNIDDAIDDESEIASA